MIDTVDISQTGLSLGEKQSSLQRDDVKTESANPASEAKVEQKRSNSLKNLVKRDSFI